MSIFTEYKNKKDPKCYYGQCLSYSTENDVCSQILKMIWRLWMKDAVGMSLFLINLKETLVNGKKKYCYIYCLYTSKFWKCKIFFLNPSSQCYNPPIYQHSLTFLLKAPKTLLPVLTMCS